MGKIVFLSSDPKKKQKKIYSDIKIGDSKASPTTSDGSKDGNNLKTSKKKKNLSTPPINAHNSGKQTTIHKDTISLSSDEVEWMEDVDQTTRLLIPSNKKNLPNQKIPKRI